MPLRSPIDDGGPPRPGELNLVLCSDAVDYTLVACATTEAADAAPYAYPPPRECCGSLRRLLGNAALQPRVRSGSRSSLIFSLRGSLAHASVAHERAECDPQGQAEPVAVRLNRLIGPAQA